MIRPEASATGDDRVGGVITHWDEIEGARRERGHLAATWKPLTGANSVTVGVQRIEVEPGRWATPLHLEGSEEEIFYVLSGSGVSVQRDGQSEEAFAVGAGDCLVHLALEHAHTIGAGDDGLVVLAFGAAALRGEYAACPVRASRGSGRLGCSKGRRRIIRGRVRRLPARRMVGALRAAGPDRERRRSRAPRAGRGDRDASSSRSWRCGRIGAHRPGHYTVPAGNS